MIVIYVASLIFCLTYIISREALCGFHASPSQLLLEAVISFIPVFNTGMAILVLISILKKAHF